MRLWTCKNCGAVFTEQRNKEIEGVVQEDEEGEEYKEFYLRNGACTGCAGKGVMLEPLE